MMNRISCFWILFLGFTFYNLSVSQARLSSRHHATAVVVGTVFCDACFHQDFSKASHFMSGAIVAVECADFGKRSSFYKKVKTNEHGEFRVHLPFLVNKHVKKIYGCSVKLISSSKPYCAVASRAASSSFRLKTRREGRHIFSAGFFTFKPVNQPKLCKQKPIIHRTNDKAAYPQKSLTTTPNYPKFSPPSNFLTIKEGLLPTIPLLPPLPQLPPLPPLPVFPPLFPSPSQSPPSLFPPINPPPIPGSTPLPPPIKGLTPFPPSIPGLTPFPPSIPGLTPLPPSIPGLTPLPPSIPGLTPLPPPPPPPFQGFPPFPFRPMPGFPGVPPPATSSQEKKTSP